MFPASSPASSAGQEGTRCGTQRGVEGSPAPLIYGSQRPLTYPNCVGAPSSPALRERTRGNRILLDFSPMVCYISGHPPHWGPAHDGGLGRGGGRPCGWGMTCATLPGAQEKTRGHYDPRAGRHAPRFQEPTASAPPKASTCEVRALLSALPPASPLEHRAGQRPRLPIFLSGDECHRWPSCRLPGGRRPGSGRRGGPGFPCPSKS